MAIAQDDLSDIDEVEPVGEEEVDDDDDTLDEDKPTDDDSDLDEDEPTDDDSDLDDDEPTDDDSEDDGRPCRGGRPVAKAYRHAFIVKSERKRAATRKRP